MGILFFLRDSLTVSLPLLRLLQLSRGSRRRRREKNLHHFAHSRFLSWIWIGLASTTDDMSFSPSPTHLIGESLRALRVGQDLCGQSRDVRDLGSHVSSAIGFMREGKKGVGTCPIAKMSLALKLEHFMSRGEGQMPWNCQMYVHK